jgi:hypothetical protein
VIMWSFSYTIRDLVLLVPPRIGHVAPAGRRRTYLTILEWADHALFKKVRYVLLRTLRPELDGQDVEVLIVLSP